jgi:hypothetical protein
MDFLEVCRRQNAKETTASRESQGVGETRRLCLKAKDLF